MAIAKNWKRFYIPGIISLAIIPFIFYYYSHTLLKTLHQGVIPVYWYDPELSKNNPEVFSGEYPPKRNYIDITLTGNNQDDSIKLNFSQIRLRELLRSNDSLNGIHFQFGDSSQYWSFVRALDICRIEKAKTYMPYENSLWVYHIPPDTTIQTFVCGTSYTLIKEEPSWFAISMENITAAWRSSWLLILGFVCFAGFSMGMMIIGKKNGR
jgi:hypothetical protein